MKIEPLIVVKDVTLSSRFYQKALGLKSGHGGNEYEMLMANGKLVLQLHHENTQEHPGLYNTNNCVGNGVALCFITDEFERLVMKIRSTDALIISEPHINTNAQRHEIWFRDPDGYTIVVSNHFGDAKTEPNKTLERNSLP